MGDYERYGDYNEVDEAPGKSRVGLIIKITAAVLCVAVIGLLVFRLITFYYYPDSMKKLYFTEELTAFYNERGGDIGALTQELRTPYDNADEGNFFCDNLIVIPELGELQVSLRYNTSIADTLKEKYGMESFDPDDKNQFSFRLYRSGLSLNEADHVMRAVVTTEWDSFMMYRYCKIVFDGLDFGPDKLGDEPEWIRLEVFIKGIDEPFMIPIYENNVDYSEFTEYELSKEEKPE